MLVGTVPQMAPSALIDSQAGAPDTSEYVGAGLPLPEAAAL